MKGILSRTDIKTSVLKYYIKYDLKSRKKLVLRARESGEKNGLKSGEKIFFKSGKKNV